MTKDPIHIFVGPMKTGTTWLHSLRNIDGPDKEIRFPTSWGRNFIYRRFVRDETVLVWPYLLHQPDSLRSLLDACDGADRQVVLYASWRPPASWRASMTRFSRRASTRDQTDFIEQSEATIRATLRELKATRDLRCVRIIAPRPRDIAAMSEATGISTRALTDAQNDVVYATDEKGRVDSAWLGHLFFRIKPFLPRAIRGLRRGSGLWRRIFYR